MPKGLMDVHFHWRRFALCVAVFFLVGGIAMEQANEKSSLEDQALNKEKRTTLRGCLYDDPLKFYLATDLAYPGFALTGNTSGFEKYRDREMILEGRDAPPVRVEGRNEPFPASRDHR